MRGRLRADPEQLLRLGAGRAGLRGRRRQLGRDAGHDPGSPRLPHRGLLEQGEPLPEPKLSIAEAIAYHNQPIPEDVLRSFAEYGDDTPILSTRFELVEVEVPAPQAAQAG